MNAEMDLRGIGLGLLVRVWSHMRVNGRGLAAGLDQPFARCTVVVATGGLEQIHSQ